MKKMRINLAGTNYQALIERIVESACAARYLQLTAKGTRRKYPGCVHWHHQKITTSGAPEITYWPSKHRRCFPLQAGRAKPWVIEMIKELNTQIERQVSL